MEKGGEGKNEPSIMCTNFNFSLFCIH